MVMYPVTLASNHFHITVLCSTRCFHYHTTGGLSQYVIVSCVHAVAAYCVEKVLLLNVIVCLIWY